ncbi:MAG: hypothetical protein ACTSQZ_08725 [Candidatus Thorarchaeota archaeon]
MVNEREGATSAIILHFTPGKPVEFPAEFVADILSRNFLKQLNFAFNDAKLSDIIFTTGVCLRGEKCYYECYFVPDQLAIALKELEESLQKIPGVSRVVLRKVA